MKVAASPKMTNIASVTLETQDSYHLVGESKNTLTKTPEMADKDEVNSVPADNPQANDPVCDIRYTYNCDDSYGADFTKKSDNVPLDLRITTAEEDDTVEKLPRVLEVVTEVMVRTGRLSVEDTPDSEENLKDVDSGPLGNVRIREIGNRKIIIHSALLLDAIREVVEYYPRWSYIPV